MQIGLGRSKALRALGERTSLPEIRGFVSSMVQADARHPDRPGAAGAGLEIRSAPPACRAGRSAGQILLPLMCHPPACSVVLSPRDQHHRRLLLGSHVNQLDRVTLASQVFCIAAVLG
jgi:hypothetical protein